MIPRKMRRESLFLTILVLLVILSIQGSSFTNHLDVLALQDLYKTLNFPPELTGWRWNGGDPCDEAWAGVSCSDHSILYLNIQGLNLSGYLGDGLHNLNHLKLLDISSNNIWGEVPYELPPNATHINMACNHLTQNLPYSLPMMKNLRHLNLSHNALSGPIGDVFSGLDNLAEMDLSYNNFTGDLPSSVASLTKLRRLFLERNKFSGSVTYLAKLPLTDLNIQDNSFSGTIPRHFHSITNLWIGGNKFDFEDDYPPWDFNVDNVPVGQNMSVPPTSHSSAIKNYPSLRDSEHKKRSIGVVGIASIVGGVVLMVTGAVIFIALRRKIILTEKPNRLTGSDSSLENLPISTPPDCSITAPEDKYQLPALNPSPLLPPKPLPPVCRTRNDNKSKRSSVRKCRFLEKAKVYTIAELQSATSNFSRDNLVVEGSLGSIYKAEFLDGQVLSVKNINMAGLHPDKEERFLDAICTTSRLRHPNILSLKGYCIGHGHHILVYEYVTNLSLDKALHGEARNPLSWIVRLRIALGVAKALEYMHCKLSPPIAHNNLKADNILLDEDLIPRVCDCGLAILKPLISGKTKNKGSEIVTSNTSLIAPEHGESVSESIKNDIYAFGELLLELLTGRKPFDNSRRKAEQSLVRWASFRLHDSEFLEQMVDPSMKKTFSSKDLSRFADIVSLCVQPLTEYRPPISEIVESLTSLLQNHLGKTSAGGAPSHHLLERSSRSTSIVHGEHKHIKLTPTYSAKMIGRQLKDTRWHYDSDT